MRAVAMLATLVSAVLALKMFLQFHDRRCDGYQFEQQIPWVAISGHQLSRRRGRHQRRPDPDGRDRRVRGGVCLLGNQGAREGVLHPAAGDGGGILGAFASLDLFFFYFFHELALVPTFIMIGVWGRGERKNYATFQITLYLSIGALIALIGLIALYLQSGANTFDIPELTKHLQANPLSSSAQNFIFPLLLFGFGILVSLWPFHTWAPLGYGSAPTADRDAARRRAEEVRALRPDPHRAAAAAARPRRAGCTILAWLCLGNLVYCGWVAMRQKDFNWLIGYSSVAHMGFIFLGIASLNLIGVTGAVLVMIAHGFLAALTFGLSGYIYQQTGTLEMDRLGGLLRRLPFIGAALMMAAFAGCGLPGFANFVGEITVFFGAWKAFPARDRSRLLGRADHRRGLHAASGPGDAARAAAGAMGQRGRCAQSLAQDALHPAARQPAGLRLLPRLLTDKIQAACVEKVSSTAQIRLPKPAAKAGTLRRRVPLPKRGASSHRDDAAMMNLLLAQSRTAGAGPRPGAAAGGFVAPAPAKRKLGYAAAIGVG